MKFLQGFLSRRNPQREQARTAYLAAVARAREPRFYGAFNVPDTLDGRFEMIVLHVFLLVHRLEGEGAAADAFCQALVEALFDDMDRSLREIGVGDLSVGRKVKQMAAAYFGRSQAYREGLAGDDAALAAALRRNVYGTVEPGDADVAALARYVRAEAAELAARAGEEIIASGGFVRVAAA